MKKKILLLFFTLCADIVVLPTLYAHDSIDQLHEEIQDGGDPVLDLDDDEDIISDDEDLLAILDESMDEPSILWTWFCTIGSSLAAHCIHVQRYVGRLMDRMRLWLKIRGKLQEQRKEIKQSVSSENS